MLWMCRALLRGSNFLASRRAKALSTHLIGTEAHVKSFMFAMHWLHCKLAQSMIDSQLKHLLNRVDSILHTVARWRPSGSCFGTKYTQALWAVCSFAEADFWACPRLDSPLFSCKPWPVNLKSLYDILLGSSISCPWTNASRFLSTTQARAMFRFSVKSSSERDLGQWSVEVCGP